MGLKKLPMYCITADDLVRVSFNFYLCAALDSFFFIFIFWIFLLWVWKLFDLIFISIKTEKKKKKTPDFNAEGPS